MRRPPLPPNRKKGKFVSHYYKSDRKVTQENLINWIFQKVWSLTYVTRVHCSGNMKQPNKQGMCHIVALPFTIKKYLQAKEECSETQIFHHVKI